MQTHAQEVIIFGQISEKSTDESIIGANIVEVDENGRYVNGTVTDVEGNYTLQVSSIDAKVQVSFIGYKTQSFVVRNQGFMINAELEMQSAELDEVVVRGEKMGNDGLISIRDRATAVSRIELTDLQTVATTSVEEMLQGRLGNVDIAAVSGDPGAGLNIRIRGTATLNANNEPLIVINGIPYDASIDEDFDFTSADVQKFGNLIDVAPEDIESIEVLKDAAASAVWGSRASNGVLLIKTKRGVKSKPIFEYTYKVTRSEEPDPIPLLDGPGYVKLIKEAHFNNNAGQYQNYSIDYDPTYEEYYNYSQNTDWIDEITKVAFTQQHNFAIRGGGEKSRYNMSLGYFDQEGTTIGTGLKKLTLRTSLDYELSKKLRFTTDILFTRYDQDATYDAEDSDFGYRLIRSVAYKKMPNMAVYEHDSLGNAYTDFFTPVNTIQGDAKDIYNPVAFAELGEHKRIKDNARALFRLKYNIAPTLTYDGTITLDIFDQKYKKFLPFKAIGYNYSDNLTNQAVEEYGKKTAIFTLNKLIWKPNLGDNHQLLGLAQAITEESVSKTYKSKTSRSASMYLTDASGYVNLESFNSGISEFRSINSTLSFHYKLFERYILSAGLTGEGNSRFSRESRWGIFPFFTSAWILSEENFLKNARFINDLKLRFSWGISGNSSDENYMYYSTYDARVDYAYNGKPGVKPGGVELTDLQWETIEQINPGLSFIGFKNRLIVEFDLYKKHTRNLYLKDSKIPSHSGYTYISQNEGEMVNQGWEFMFDVRIVDMHDFKVNLNFNASANENIILNLPKNFSLEYGDMLANGQYKISLEPGQAIGGFYGYRYDGVYIRDEDVIVRDVDGNPVYDISEVEPLYMIHGSGYQFEAGDAKYYDKNHDGVINELDIIYLGDLNPDFMGGIGPRIEYKGVVLNMFLHYKVGQKIINKTRMDTEKMYNHDNQSKTTNWRWRRPGDVTDVPRALYGKGYNWLGSDRFVEDGSFLRIKTISLSYNFKKELCRKLHVNKMKVYGTAYNLYTWTNYSGQDPDIGLPGKPDKLPMDESRTPPPKNITVGVNITF